MASPTQKSKPSASSPKPVIQKPAAPKKPPPPPKPVLVLEDDIPIPPIHPPDEDDTEVNRSISVYPATVSTFVADIRPPTPGVEEIRSKLKVNYDDFGFRLDDKMRESLKSLTREIEAKERVSADLEQELATRKRLLTAAQTAFCVVDDYFLRSQVKARDRQIAVLSDRLFEVIAKGKLKTAEEVRAKDRVISALQGEVECLSTAIKQREELIAEISDKEKGRIFELELDNERLSLAVETNISACEAGKIRLNQTERGLLEARSEGEKQAKTVGELSTANRELSDKLRKLGEELDRNHREKFEFEVKIAAGERLEREIDSLKSNKTMYERQFDKLTKATANIEAEKDKARSGEEFVRQECAKIASLVGESVTWLESEGEKCEETPGLVGKCKAEMEEIRGKLVDLARNPTQIAPEAAASVAERSKLKLSAKESNFEVETLKETVASLESVKNTYEIRIKSLESDLSFLKSDHYTSISSKEAELKQAKDQCESLKQQLNRIIEQGQDREIAISKANLHINTLNQRLDAQKTTQEGQFFRIKSAEKQIKSLTEQIAVANRQLVAKEKEIAYRDKSYRELSQKLKVMEVEMWNKDSDLLQKEAKIVELQQETAELRLEIDQFGLKLRKTVAEELMEVNRMLEDKNNQIELLKSMLRSSQTQVKQKDVDIQRYKLKTEKISPTDACSPRRPTDLKSPKAVFSLETREALDNFQSQIERLRKFVSSKSDKIATAEANGSLNSTWLKDELKLSKPPSEQLSATEVLRLSVEQRVNSLLLKVQTVCESAGEAEEVVMGWPEMRDEKWEGLVETLRKYSSKVLGRE